MTAQILDLRLATVDPGLMALRLLRHAPQPVELLSCETVAIMLGNGLAHTLETPSHGRVMVLSDAGRITLETLENRRRVK